MKTLKSIWLLTAVTLVFFSCRKADLSSLNSDAAANQAAASLSNRQGSAPVSESGIDARIEGSSLLPASFDWDAFCYNPVETDGVDTTGITFCSRMTVPLCTETGSNIGTVTVKTGSDKNTYITYSLIPAWYFVSINLFVGDVALIPSNGSGIANPARFPYIKVFNSVKQVWNFKVGNLPAYFTVAAQVTAVKVNGYAPNNYGNGNKGKGKGKGKDKNDDDDDHNGGNNNNNDDDDDDNGGNNNNNDDDDDYGGNNNNDDDDDDNGHGECEEVQVAWGDGCSGTQISLLDWATRFNYLKGNCMNVEEQICSKAINLFFDSTINGVDIEWPDVNGSGVLLDILGLPILGSNNGNVTVGGHNYTEAEGRAIFNTISSIPAPDCKKAFIALTTLILSRTNYAQAFDPTLAKAVSTIETWLATKGKISPTYLPTGNASVRDAAIYIESWIKMYTCSDRR